MGLALERALARRLWVAALVAAVLASAAPASAQIYSWRDANGNLVLSNHRPASTSDVRTFSVPESRTVRTTRGMNSVRSRLYDDLIVEHARLNGVRTDLVRAVVQVESGYNPYARSPKGALGLMQLMPATIQQFGVRNAFDPEQNVRAGVAYLRQLLDRYENNEELALAAYNAGPGAVDSHGQAVPPYRETRDYLTRINQMASRPIERRTSQIYKVTEMVDGHEVTRYTDQKPASGTYELVSRQ
jgi:soluble lytic murein transglycosylase-like protein